MLVGEFRNGWSVDPGTNGLSVPEYAISLCATETQVDFRPVRAAVERCLADGLTSAAAICQAIGTAGLSEFSPQLIALLEAGPGLRAPACQALGQLQCREAISKIISVYAGADREFHRVADQALIDMGREALPALLKELETVSDPCSRLAIIKALAALQENGNLSETLVDNCLQQLKNLELFRNLPILLEQSGLSALAELSHQRCRELYGLQIEACWSVLASLYDPFVVSQIKTASQNADLELRDTSWEALSEGLAGRRLARAMLEALSHNDYPKRAANQSSVEAFIKGAQTWGDYWLSEIASAALVKLEGGSSVEEPEMLSLLDKVMLLKAQDLFSCLQLEELGLLARVARLEIFPDTTVLMHEGTPNSKLYMIIKGHIELSAHSSNGVNATIAVLGAGEAVGDSTVFDDAVSPVTAEVILGEAAFLTIDGEDIQRLCNLYPGIATGFIKAMSTRIRKLEQMVTHLA